MLRFFFIRHHNAYKRYHLEFYLLLYMCGLASSRLSNQKLKIRFLKGKKA